MKLKIISILIILASLDSSLFAQQSVGLKPSNLILSDLAKYQNNCLFIAGKGFNNKYYEEPTIFNYVVEGVSGYALGFVGFMGMGLASLVLMWGANDVTADQAHKIQSGVLAMWMGGTALGSFCGVSLSGKLMKKRNGSDAKAAVGTIAVAVTGWLLGYINEGFAITSMLVIPIGTVIGYNWD